VAEKPEIKPVEPDLGNSSVGNHLIPFLCLISREAVAIWNRIFFLFLKTDFFNPAVSGSFPPTFQWSLIQIRRYTMQSRDVSKAVILVAMAVALSPFFIPVGISKCFPAQHMINVIAAVILGPVYAVAIALAAAIIRNILGLGTLLAFPGGMIGALLAGIFYKSTRNIYIAGLGEIFGTGVLGSLAAIYIVGPMLLGKTMAMGALMVAFSVSTIGGSVIGIVALHLLQKGGVWQPASK
jgi:energy coupling factor transporter S component ThiW